MKKLLLTIATILFIGATAFAQFGCTCLRDGITFSMQQQIDDFQTNYPHCKRIEGDVVIDSKISNLNGLNVLTSIGGSLNVYGNDSLITFSGLNSLNSVGNDFIIWGNDSLLSLSGLENLQSVEGNLEIGSFAEGEYIGNYSLDDLTALENLAFVGGDIHIVNNHSLTQLNGLSNLNYIAGGLFIWGNTNLISLSGLQPDSIGGSIYIEKNNSLSDLTALENLNTITGKLFIVGNNSLVDLSGLKKIITVSDDLCIGGSNLLEDLNGLKNLTSVGGNLKIGFKDIGGGFTNYYSNNSLTTLSGLENLISVGGGLEIHFDSSLTSLSALESLITIGGSIYITDNPLLSVCEVPFLCDYISTPNGRIEIHDNAPNCSSMARLAYNCGITLPCRIEGTYYFYNQADIDYFPLVYNGCFELADHVFINGNDITNLEGLNEVVSIEGMLTIKGNIALTELTGLEHLSSIHKLLIWGNDSLDNIESLRNLTEVRNITITSNDALQSLTGLENINSDSLIYLKIGVNKILSDCAIESICNYLAGLNTVARIFGNDPGCNSREEVQEECMMVHVGEQAGNDENNGLVYPNPACNNLHITWQAENNGLITITIYNHLGQKTGNEIKMKISSGSNDFVINIVHLKKGFYLLQLTCNGKVVTKKFIKS